jgi:hypothetical protein
MTAAQLQGEFDDSTAIDTAEVMVMGRGESIDLAIERRL